MAKPKVGHTAIPHARARVRSPESPIVRVENKMAPMLPHPVRHFAGAHGNWVRTRAELEFTGKTMCMLESLYESLLTRV